MPNVDYDAVIGRFDENNKLKYEPMYKFRPDQKIWCTANDKVSQEEIECYTYTSGGQHWWLIKDGPNLPECYLHTTKIEAIEDLRKRLASIEKEIIRLTDRRNMIERELG